MSFKAVWGFDPEEIAKVKPPADDFPSTLGAETTREDAVSDDSAGIPSSFEAQIYELRRIFRL